VDYLQDSTSRVCGICDKSIEEGERMIDVFREESAREGSKQRVAWVHSSCARAAIGRWLKKKLEKQKT
jgi:hypothetical protein